MYTKKTNIKFDINGQSYQIDGVGVYGIKQAPLNKNKYLVRCRYFSAGQEIKENESVRSFAFAVNPVWSNKLAVLDDQVCEYILHTPELEQLFPSVEPNHVPNPEAFKSGIFTHESLGPMVKSQLMLTFPLLDQYVISSPGLIQQAWSTLKACNHDWLSSKEVDLIEELATQCSIPLVSE